MNERRAGARAESARLAPFPVAAALLWAAVTAGWWLFALAPLPPEQAWLLRARAVCFGALPNGLPETWGWMLLVLGPLSLAGFLFAVWGADLLASARWLARRAAGVLLLALLALGALLGAGAAAARVVSARRAETAALAPLGAGALPAGYPRGAERAPELGLGDQRGATVDLAALAGRPAVVTFAFAHCSTVCPVLVQTLRRALELAGEEAPSLVVVTLDPWRDTPGSLPAMTAAWRLDALPRAHVLSGPPDAVERVRAAWQVPAERNLATGEIVHPGLLFVLDADGRLAYRFLNPPPEWVAQALARLARERGGDRTRGRTERAAG
jgi:protein SCO1/2